MQATMANRVDNAKPATAEKPTAKEAPEAAAAATAPAKASGGIKPFIPLIANVVLMPVLAYALTAFVLVPKLAKKSGAGAAANEAAAEPASEHGKESSGGKSDASETKDASGKAK